MSIEIVPTGAALGAEIRGVNLARRIDDETFAAIERAYNDHGVIFFRDQHITPPQQVAFTHRSDLSFGANSLPEDLPFGPPVSEARTARPAWANHSPEHPNPTRRRGPLGRDL